MTLHQHQNKPEAVSKKGQRLVTCSASSGKNSGWWQEELKRELEDLVRYMGRVKGGVFGQIRKTKAFLERRGDVTRKLWAKDYLFKVWWLLLS